MRKMWGIGLLMVALSAASAEPAPKPIHFRAHARVALDAHGVPQQVDVDQKLPAVIRAKLEMPVAEGIRACGTPSKAMVSVSSLKFFSPAKILRTRRSGSSLWA